MSGDSTASRIGAVPLWIGARARRHIDSTWSAIPSAAASTDYAQAVTAEMPGELPTPSGATPLDQAGLAYANAMRNEAVLLDAYLQSYERLLGARDAHDAGATLRHAVAMVAFADALITQGRTAAERRHIVLVLGAEALARMDSVRRAHHRAWDETVRRSTAASTPDAARVLDAAGVPSPMDSTVPRELAHDAARSVRPDILVRQVRVRVRADSLVRASFADSRYAATWPEPPDVASLAHARAFALKAVQQADSGRQLAFPNAASDSASAAVTTGDRSGPARRRAWPALVILAAVGAIGAGGALLLRRATARA